MEELPKYDIQPAVPPEKRDAPPVLVQERKVEASPSDVALKKFTEELAEKKRLEAVADLKKSLETETKKKSYMLVDTMGEVGVYAPRRREVAVLPNQEEALRLMNYLVAVGRRPEDFIIEESTEKPDIETAQAYREMKPRPLPQTPLETAPHEMSHGESRTSRFWERIRNFWIQ